MRTWFTLFLMWVTLHAQMNASDIDVAQLQIQQDEKLAQALGQLAELRSLQQKKLSQLNQKLREVKQEEQHLRKQFLETKEQLDAEQAKLTKQRESRKTLEKEAQSLDRVVLSEALSNIEARYPWWQKNDVGELLRRTQVELSHSKATTWQKNTQQLKMISDDTQRLSDRFGIEEQSVSLAVPHLDGRHVQGQLTILGPWSYFKADDVKGMVSGSPKLSLEQPELKTLPSDLEPSLITWLDGKSDMLPVDLSEGAYFEKSDLREQNWRDHLKKGGLWVYPILGFGLLASLVSLLKIWQLFQIRQPSPRMITKIAEAIELGKREEAEQLIGMLTPLWRSMMRASLGAKASVEWMEESMMEQIMLIQPKLQRGLTVIAVTATTAPLLGLLGTVTGIIKTFKAMEHGGAETQALVQGISEALITTELGLVFAIPALVIHALLSRRVHAVLANMERSCMVVVNVLSKPQNMTSDGADHQDQAR